MTKAIIVRDIKSPEKIGVVKLGTLKVALER